jgi:hypothetical protein
MASDDVYINPMVYQMLGAVSHMDGFPDEDTILLAYTTLHSLPPEDIVSLIVGDSNFISYADIVKGAIDGMDIRGIGRVVTQFVDRNWPALMQRINSNDDEFELYKAVIIGLVDKIRMDGIENEDV